MSRVKAVRAQCAILSHACSDARLFVACRPKQTKSDGAPSLWRHTVQLFCFVVVFVFALTYVWLYVSIVRFRVPGGWLCASTASAARWLATRTQWQQP